MYVTEVGKLFIPDKTRYTEGVYAVARHRI